MKSKSAYIRTKFGVWKSCTDYGLRSHLPRVGCPGARWCPWLADHLGSQSSRRATPRSHPGSVQRTTEISNVLFHQRYMGVAAEKWETLVEDTAADPVGVPDRVLARALSDDAAIFADTLFFTRCWSAPLDSSP